MGQFNLIKTILYDNNIPFYSVHNFDIHLQNTICMFLLVGTAHYDHS